MEQSHELAVLTAIVSKLAEALKDEYPTMFGDGVPLNDPHRLLPPDLIVKDELWRVRWTSYNGSISLKWMVDRTVQARWEFDPCDPKLLGQMADKIRSHLFILSLNTEVYDAE